MVFDGTKVVRIRLASKTAPLREYIPFLNMEKNDWKAWLQRAGAAGFMFFLLKGLLWLAVLGGTWKAACN